MDAKEHEAIVDLCTTFAMRLTSNNHDAAEREARLRDVTEPGSRFDQMIDLLKKENKGALPLPFTKDEKTVLDVMTILGGMVGQNGVTTITQRPEPDGRMACKVMLGKEEHNAFLVVSVPPHPKVMGISNNLSQQLTLAWFSQKK